MKYSDKNNNVCYHFVPRPKMVAKFFSALNANDVINQQQQGFLRLEKKWKTFNPYFRLETTRIGWSVVDAFNLCLFHKFIDKRMFNQGGKMQLEEVPIRSFGGILGKQMMSFGKILQSNEFGSSLIYNDHLLLNSSDGNTPNRKRDRSTAFVNGDDSSPEIIYIDCDDEGGEGGRKKMNTTWASREVLCSAVDVNGCEHKLMKYHQMHIQASGKRYTVQQKCVECGTRRTSYICITCDTPCCFHELSSNRNRSIDAGVCFKNHVNSVPDKNRAVTRRFASV